MLPSSFWYTETDILSHLLLSLGTSKGFGIYHTDPFSRIFSSDDGNIAIIEMLFSTSLVALILSPRHLIIQNTKVGAWQ